MSLNIYGQIDINSPATLDKANTTYRLINDISAKGTAFTITADNVTLDLNGHKIVYNENFSEEKVYGIKVVCNNATVKNGIIIQGKGSSSNSSGLILRSGSGHNINNLIIKVYGKNCRGIESYASKSEIHHIYIENHGTTSDIAYAPDCIYAESRNEAGMKIYDNILVKGHRGINLNFFGIYVDSPQKTYVYNNLIQHERTPGTKAPYGIALAKCRNVDVFNNQIISDNGRGIILDGLGQGVPRGTDYINVYNNRVDVQYSVMANSGQYVENNIYALRDRFSSGDNVIKDNIFMVENEVEGYLHAISIGSGATDPLMKNIKVFNNTIIARDQNNKAWGGPYIFYLQYVNDMEIVDNQYFTDGKFSNEGEYEFHVDHLIKSGNEKINPSNGVPSPPTGLTITKFLNSYLIQWEPNPEANVFEYIVYKDGQKLPISPRGGNFYVDVEVDGIHSYSISALTLNNIEGPKSNEISTNNAKNGWWDNSSVPSANGPTIPKGLRVTK
ncbi:MAG: hypothetical protein ACTSPQ_13980 [Candidatus Helarchaeota archaeon]